MGLGRAIGGGRAGRRAPAGATARTPTQLADLVDRYGDQVRAVALDVTDPRRRRPLCRSRWQAFGQLDVLVNNAGYANVPP